MNAIRFISLIVASSLATLAVAQPSEYELVKLVTERKAFMFYMQDAYLALLSIRRGKNTDFGSASETAQSISENVGKFVELLLPDTGEGHVPNSRAKREIWTEPAEFAAAVDALRTSTTLLSETARGNNIEAFNAQFDVVQQACFGCHGLMPSSGGRFRSPK